MSGEITQQQLLEVQAHFKLPSPALVEKDFYVVKALAAITSAPLPLPLAFGGGTALSRAHRLIHRMSEDIDLKIIDDDPARPALRSLRDVITKALLDAGFQFDPGNEAHRHSRNQSRYTMFRLPYQPLAAGEGALRPEIQIEVAVWPLRQASVELPVSSFVAEAYKRPAEVARIACISIAQTVAEKFVALTRRTAAEVAGAGGPRDSTLPRHIYDLHMVRQKYDAAEVAAMARDIIPHDIEVYGHQFPAYCDDPMRETRRAVEALASDKQYAERYALFQRDMVYSGGPEYKDALTTIAALADLLVRGN